MTITLTDADRPGDGTSLNAALARAAATPASTGPTSLARYGSVTVRMTVRGGKVTTVVAV
jgi:hypothetical protein